MRMQDKHLLASVTKVFIGTAAGILGDRGRIDIRRTVGEYILALKGTPWGQVTIRDVLEMASGMEGSNESYTGPQNKHYQYEASLGWQPTTPEMPESVAQGDTYRYLASLKQIRKPGESWAYTSVNTAILGWLLEEITRKSIADVLSEQIWSEIGAEADAFIVMNKKGVAAAHGGMSTTLRDLARFGLLFTPSWRATSRTQIISDRFCGVLPRTGGRPWSRTGFSDHGPPGSTTSPINGMRSRRQESFSRAGSGDKFFSSIRRRTSSSRILARTRHSMMWGRC